ncbi:hypothetical protein ACG83_41280 [Frankia sp. R43]|uniref:hypothetical protein n=1 Tax=Frankia sp. R43 TaxID=269536 RepID=UPI0006C9ED61|nr:hypothetical protein [Frankia sp. R43]KPM50254.1 hypothetical protein ACG83_41280 [Frankia sp. R43]
MTAPTAAPPRVGVHIAEDIDYYAAPVGDEEIVAEERRHFADGTWSAYLLCTVVECPHCGHHYTTDALGGVVVDTTSLVDAIVWADDPSLADADDYLHEQIRDLIDTEQANPTPPTEWVPLPVP